MQVSTQQQHIVVQIALTMSQSLGGLATPTTGELSVFITIIKEEQPTILIQNMLTLGVKRLFIGVKGLFVIKTGLFQGIISLSMMAAVDFLLNQLMLTIVVSMMVGGIIINKDKTNA
ncbi:hypothetical protein clem_02115 [Legionella clemsonensis]|uniref:Uncharacterized protein n=1 Tax=Legionella clemsonensis TaxID=1867846 RepID=A0A222NZI7_9GAMM|nr:hypothetical protein clem_02115 [Legionella clemsonensis]